MAWKLFGFLKRRALISDPASNASLEAYIPGLAPPPALFVGRGGRVVQRSFAPCEGALIQLGNGAVQSAIVASSLGVNLTPDLQPLAKRASLL